MSESIQTVNVIEMIDGVLCFAISYPETRKGNEAAESLFEQAAQENGIPPEEIEIGLEEGYIVNGKYSIFLVHSMSEKERAEIA